MAPVTVSASTAGSSDSDGTIAGVEIDFGDGTVVAAASATHVYPVSGAYTVVAKVTDNLGSSSTASSTVNVLANQPPKAVLSLTPRTGTAPVSVSASTAGSSDVDGTIVSSQIDFGDGTVVTGSAATHSYKVPGTYTVIAKVTDNLGATSAASSTITVAAPAVTISQPVMNASVNSPVRVTASAVSGLPITGMWVYVDNVGVYSVYTSSLNTTLNIAPGKHVIMVKAWDSSGNISVSTANITVLSGTAIVRPTRASRDNSTLTPTSTAQPQAGAATATIDSTRTTRSLRLQPGTPN
jgi:hypothetical protein